MPYFQSSIWGKGVDLSPTGQRIVAPALARTQKLRHNLQLQVTSLGRAPVVWQEFVASRWSVKLPSLLRETGTTRHVCTAMIRAKVLMLHNEWFENRIVGVMFSMFLFLQGNETKSTNTKCNRSPGLNMYVKVMARILKICIKLSVPPSPSVFLPCRYIYILLCPIWTLHGAFQLGLLKMNCTN